MTSPSRRLSILIAWAALGISPVLLGADAPAEAPEGTPEWMVARFFTRDNPPDASKYYTAQMAATYKAKNSHLGAAFPATGVTITQERFFADETMQAFSVRVQNSSVKGQSIEYYVYLKNVGGSWKLDTARQFYIHPGVSRVFMVLAPKGGKLTPEEQNEWDMASAFGKANADLEAEFRQNEVAFDKLAAAMLERSGGDVIHSKRRSSSVSEQLWQQIRSLGLYYVQLSPKGWLECAKGGYSGSSFGYLWVHPKAEPPRPSPDEMIYVKQLAAQWYFFRRQQLR